MTKSEPLIVTKDLFKYLIFIALMVFLVRAPAVFAQQSAESQQSVQQLLQRIKAKQQALQQSVKTETNAVSEQAVEISEPAQQNESQSLDTPVAPSAMAENTPITQPLILNNDSNKIITAPQSRFSVGEELLLSLSVNGLALTEMFVVKTNKLFLLGLGDFFQLIEYPVTVDVAAKQADGWFLREQNEFSIRHNNDNTLSVFVLNKQHTVAEQDYQFTQDDLYVDAALLKEWFGFEFDVDEARLAVNIVSSTKFPVEARLARRNRPAAMAGDVNRSIMPLKESPYQLYSAPMLDMQVAGRQTKTDTLGSYSVLGNLDLAYFNTEFFLSGNNDDALNSSRLTLGRQSPQGELLGPLNATGIAFGDVTPVNAGFGSTLQQSRGIYVTNTPLNQVFDNRRTNITGEVQVGWDVELYRNGILLDSKIAIADGRYEFNDVDLTFGQNDFELVFYGPQGQIETKTESYLIDGNTVTTGQARYRVSVVDVNKSLLGLNDPITEKNNQGLLTSATFDYGFTKWLSMTAGTSWFKPEVGEEQQFYSLGTNVSFGQYGLLSSVVSADKDSRNSINTNFRTRFWQSNWSFNHRYDEIFAAADNDATSTHSYAVTMTGSLSFPILPVLNYQNSWFKTAHSDGRYEEVFENAIGINGPWGSLSHNVVFNKNAVSNAGNFALVDLDSTERQVSLAKNELVESDRLNAGLQYRKNFGRVFTRLFSSYAIKPDAELLSYGAVLNYPWTQQLSSELRYSYFVPEDQYQLNLGLNWQKDAFHLNTNFNYNEQGDWILGLSARFSIGYEPIRGGVFTSGRAISQSGSVAVRVFEDLNMNGVFDSEEPLIQNAKVSARQSYRHGITNEQGVVILTSLANQVTTDIVVDEESLDGPFMITAIPGVAITARKGFVDQLDFPVVKAGELEGVIYLKNEQGQHSPAPYIMLHLIDAQGDIVASTRSEFDGLYLFKSLKPGEYSLKVDDAFIDRRGLRKVKQKQLQFSSAGDLIVGVDFSLAPLEDAEGFIVSAGQFSSAGMLKLYYQMLRKRLTLSNMQKPFYIKSKENGKFVLGLAYFESADSSEFQAQQNALQLCEKLTTMQIRCEAAYHGFKY
ncbi:porin family protein [Rheinheimera gaetbuli]